MKVTVCVELEVESLEQLVRMLGASRAKVVPRVPAQQPATPIDSRAVIPDDAPVAITPVEDKFLEQVRQHPDWTAVDHANALSVSRERIRQLRNRLHITLPIASSSPHSRAANGIYEGPDKICIECGTRMYFHTGWCRYKSSNRKKSEGELAALKERAEQRQAAQAERRRGSTSHDGVSLGGGTSAPTHEDAGDAHEFPPATRYTHDGERVVAADFDAECDESGHAHLWRVPPRNPEAEYALGRCACGDQRRFREREEVPV